MEAVPTFRVGLCEHVFMSDEGPVQVYASADTTDGLLMQGQARDRRYPGHVERGVRRPLPVGPTYLWVPAEHEADARAIVEAVRAGAFALADDADITGTEAETEGEGATSR